MTEERMRCKLLYSWLSSNLEKKINAFLELHPNIEIIRMDYADTGLLGCSVMIIYEYK